jgi:protein TonB
VLHPFISNPGTRPGRYHFVLASTAFHVALLSLAVTPIVPAHFSSPPRAVEEVQYLTLSLGAAVRSVRPRAPHRTMRGVPRLPQIGPIDLSSALSIVPDLPALAAPSFPLISDSLWGDPLSASASGSDGIAPGPGRGLGVASDSGAYIAATVEKEAVGTGDNPKPVYPSDLLNRMVQARFSVFFVVDTTGRIDTTTIEVPPSVHVQFAKAVRDVLVLWHFYPAEVRGRRVRQLMEQPFEFRIVSERLARAAG